MVNKSFPRLLFISVLFCIIFLSENKYCEGSFIERDKISKLDLSKQASLIVLNSYISGSDTLNYFKARQKLLSLSYEDILSVKETCENTQSMPALNNLTSQLISRLDPEDMLILQEGIIINNNPSLKDDPFYEDTKREPRITDLKPYAEQLYFYNMRLKYGKNNLVKKTDAFWVSPREISEKKPINNPNLENQQVYFNNFSSRPHKVFSYRLNEDNQSNLFFAGNNGSVKEWFKEYEESAMCPVLKDEKIILRNAHRLFCVDLLTGKEVWSFNNSSRASGYEFYQTLRHPHHNSYGYELLVDKNMIFTELSGKLAALKLLNSCNAVELIWERNLGEYRICTKPIRFENTLIAGLINAKGELWVAGLNSGNGDLEWSTYIGTTSILAPACKIFAIDSNGVYLGTNLGILMSLNPANGGIIWIRKYEPRKYNLFDFWLNDDKHRGYYRSAFIDTAYIKFDTQFIETGEDGTLYYKPRESEYLYIINSKTGQLKEEILVDSRAYYLLRACDGKLFLLKDKGNTPRKMEFEVLEIASGRQLYKSDIKGGLFKGITYIDRKTMSLKVDNTVYFIRINNDKIELAKTDIPEDGWLLSFQDRFLFLDNSRSLCCFDAFGQNGPYAIKSMGYPKKEDICDDFAKTVKLDPRSEKAKALRNKIFRGIYRKDLPLSKMAVILANAACYLRQPEWRDIFVRLAGLYGDKVINYKDINIKFSNFLAGLRLIEVLPENRVPASDNQGYAKSQKPYSVRAAKIHLLPVNIAAGSDKQLDFYLLLNFDQLLCVNENGNIRWQRKVFYNPAGGLYDKLKSVADKNKGRMYIDDIEAHLYDNVLIVNDRINIIAVDIADGSYLWSISNAKNNIQRETAEAFNQNDPLFIACGIKRTFLENIMFHSRFMGGDLIVLHGNKIYSLNPRTGFCNNYKEINIEAALELDISGKNIYILSNPLDKILILDDKLETRRTINLNPILVGKDKYAELYFIKDTILLKARSGIFCIDKEGKLKDRLVIEGVKQLFIDEHKECFLIFEPFSRLSSYCIKSGHLTLNWEYFQEHPEPNIFWKNYGPKTRHFFVVNNRALIVSRRKANYFILALDLATGKKQWEIPLEGARGVFYDLSDYIVYNGSLNFIITTGCAECGEAYSKECAGADMITMTPKLFGVDITTGDLLAAEALPMWNYIKFTYCSLAQTKNYVIRLYFNKILKAELKTNNEPH